MVLNKKVAVILVNYQDYARRFLTDCIRGLRAQSYPRDNFKIFIVDNETSSQSENYLKEAAPEAELILNEKNAGFAKGNNDAMRKALEQNFEYFVLLNLDTIVDKDWLAELVEAAESGSDFGLIQSRMMLWQKNKSSGQIETKRINSLGNVLNYLGFGYCRGYKELWQNQISQPIEIDYASGAAVLIKKEVLKKIGMFDEEFFMYHEDADLGWRARLAGWKVVLAPKSVVCHKYEFSRSVRQFYWLERNRILMILENYKLATLLLISPAFIFMEVGLFFYGLKSGLWREKLKVYLYFLKPDNFLRIIKNHQEKNKIRVVKDKEIIKNFSGKIEFQEIENPVLKYLANPALNFYWQLVKNLIFW